MFELFVEFIAVVLEPVLEDFEKVAGKVALVGLRVALAFDLIEPLKEDAFIVLGPLKRAAPGTRRLRSGARRPFFARSAFGVRSGRLPECVRREPSRFVSGMKNPLGRSEWNPEGGEVAVVDGQRERIATVVHHHEDAGIRVIEVRRPPHDFRQCAFPGVGGEADHRHRFDQADQPGYGRSGVFQQVHGFGEAGFAGREGSGQAGEDILRPGVIEVVRVDRRNQYSRINDDVSRPVFCGSCHDGNLSSLPGEPVRKHLRVRRMDSSPRTTFQRRNTFHRTR